MTDLAEQVKEAFSKTRALFVDGRWIKGHFEDWKEDDDVCDENTALFCAVGGLRYSFDLDPEGGGYYTNGLDGYSVAIYALVQQIATGPQDDKHAISARRVLDDYGEEFLSNPLNWLDTFEEVITTWNDSEERVLRDVILSLDRAKNDVFIQEPLPLA